MASNNPSLDAALALFLDNIVGDITAQDMRIFVENVFNDKEVKINKFPEFSDLFASNTEVYEHSLVTIYDPHLKDEMGLYLSLANQPTAQSQFIKITNRLDVLVIDNLLSTSTDAALSANQGRILSESCIKTDGSNTMNTNYVAILDTDVMTLSQVKNLDFGYYD